MPSAPPPSAPLQPGPLVTTPSAEDDAPVRRRRSVQFTEFAAAQRIVAQPRTDAIEEEATASAEGAASSAAGSSRGRAILTRQRTARGSIQVNIEYDLDCDELDFRDLLSSVQALSPHFHGFNEHEQDALYPFLSCVSFEPGDVLAATGDKASWVGIVLTGTLVGKAAGRGTLATLGVGEVCGEMALFRDGRRSCDLCGGEPGTLAALSRKDLLRLYKEHPGIAHRLALAFGRAAVRKLVFPQELPRGGQAADGFGSRRVRADPMTRYAAAVQALITRGLEEQEVRKLLTKSMVIEDFAAGQPLLQLGKEIRHFGVLLLGSVSEKGVPKDTVGELVGEWWALGGFPVSADVVGGRDGATLGMLSFDELGNLAEKDGPLALKLLTLLSFGATSSGRGAAAEDVGGMLRFESGSGVASLTADASEGLETLEKQKMKVEQERIVRRHSAVAQRAAEAAAGAAAGDGRDNGGGGGGGGGGGSPQQAAESRGDKSRQGVMLRKLQREHAVLEAELAAKTEQSARAHEQVEKLSRTVERQGSHLATAATKISELQRACDLFTDSSQHVGEIKRLRDQVASRDASIAELQATVEQMDEEGEEADAAYRSELLARREVYRAREASFLARTRWQKAGSRVMLEQALRFKRMAKMRQTVISWLGERLQGDQSEQLTQMTSDYDAMRAMLSEAEAERDAQKAFAELVQKTNVSLKTQQQELLTTARQAVKRDEQLELAFQASETRVSAELRRNEGLVAERAAFQQRVDRAEARAHAEAESRRAGEGAREAVSAELDETRQRLADVSESRQRAEAACHASDAELRLAQALLAEQGSALAEAEREKEGALEALRQRERQLAALATRRSSGAASEAQLQLLVERLLELEGVFGEMVTPSAKYEKAMRHVAGAIGQRRRRPASGAGLAAPTGGLLPATAPRAAATAADEAESAGGPPPSSGRPSTSASTLHAYVPQPSRAGLGSGRSPPVYDPRRGTPALSNLHSTAPWAPAAGGFDPALSSPPPASSLQRVAPPTSLLAMAPAPPAGGASSYRDVQRGGARSSNLAASHSLPLMRAPSSVMAKVPPVARGAVRAKARRGESVTGRHGLESLVAMVVGQGAPSSAFPQGMD